MQVNSDHCTFILLFDLRLKIDFFNGIFAHLIFLIFMGLFHSSPILAKRVNQG